MTLSEEEAKRLIFGLCLLHENSDEDGMADLLRSVGPLTAEDALVLGTLAARFLRSLVELASIQKQVYPVDVLRRAVLLAAE